MKTHKATSVVFFIGMVCIIFGLMAYLKALSIKRDAQSFYVEMEGRINGAQARLDEIQMSCSIIENE